LVLPDSLTSSLFAASIAFSACSKGQISHSAIDVFHTTAAFSLSYIFSHNPNPTKLHFTKTSGASGDYKTRVYVLFHHNNL